MPRDQHGRSSWHLQAYGHRPAGDQRGHEEEGTRRRLQERGPPVAAGESALTKTHDFLDRQGPGKVFGPALAVIPYGWEEEAITIANSSKYGLGRNGVDGRPRSR